MQNEADARWLKKVMAGFGSVVAAFIAVATVMTFSHSAFSAEVCENRADDPIVATVLGKYDGAFSRARTVISGPDVPGCLVELNLPDGQFGYVTIAYDGEVMQAESFDKAKPWTVAEIEAAVKAMHKEQPKKAKAAHKKPAAKSAAAPAASAPASADQPKPVTTSRQTDTDPVRPVFQNPITDGFAALRGTK